MKRFSLIFLVMLLLSTVIMSASAQGMPAGVATHIIVFRDGVNGRSVAADVANANGLTITNVYQYALNGMAAVVPAGRLRALQNDPRVAYVEANMEVSIAQTTSQVVPTGLTRSYAASNPNLDIDGIDDWRVDADVAVLDTGIDLQHPDLNVVGGVDCTLRSGGGPFATYFCGTGNGGDDDQYHGTHVAGTIGALDNGIGVVGVAPGVRLWAVKVLNSQGSGYTSGIIAGIDWVVAQGNIEVINMSLGGSGISTAYETAINNAVANGVVVVVAAGNSAADAASYSPAFVPAAITVSALADFDGAAGGLGSPTCRTDQDDTLADFSNWGTPIDVIAPGVCILSTYPLEQGEYASISGTSMASPHVAGAAALLASTMPHANAADVQAIRNQIVNQGNLNWNNADDPDGIKERLLDVTLFSATLVANNGGGGGGGGGNNGDMSVSDIDGTPRVARNGRLSAEVSVTVSSAGNPVSGAVVTGTFSAGGTKSCTTGSNGSCTMTSGNTTGSTITFSVTGVSASGYTYVSGSNTDPDGDSDGTNITVNRP
jgi:hypothetical protein